MRNLKRVLSLTLASVMLLGMMVIGSSAAGAKKIDFADADQIENTEAVDVMVALGVLEGSGRNFLPKEVLTREQAAKIICYMLLGPDEAEKLTANSDVFKDVAADRWSAGYIAYCAERKILSGVGGGNFAPTGELTGVAFGKMLLVALGYDPAIQKYTGSSWALSVGADMVDAGIAPKGVLLSAPMTREQAAQAAFQTLTADMVDYDTRGLQYGDLTIGASKPESVTRNESGSNKNYAGGDKAGDEGWGYQQFCEKYFPTLEKKTDDKDAFGRVATKWSYDKKEICKIADEADVVYTVKTKSKDIYKDLDLSDNVDATVYTNSASSGSTFTLTKTGTNELGDKGTVIEAYKIDEDTVKLVVFNYYLAQADQDYNEKDEDIDITVVSGPALTSSNRTLKLEDHSNITSIQEDDYLVITVSDGEVQTVAPATVVENVTVSRYRADDYVTADEKYEYSSVALDGGNPGLGYALMHGDSSYTLNDDGYNFYLDPNDYVLGVEGYDAGVNLEDYLFIKEIGSNGFDRIAKALLTDGSTKTITVSKIDGNDATSSNFQNYAITTTEVDGQSVTTITKNQALQFYTFKTNSSGEYELTPIPTAGTKKVIQGDVSNATIDNVAQPIRNSGNTAAAVTNSGNASTLFIAKDKTYTGVKNAPEVEDAGTVYYVVDENSRLLIVYTENEGSITASADDIVYILDKAPSTNKVDGNDAYTYDAIVKGEKTELDATASGKGLGVYAIKSYKDGLAVLGTAVTTNGVAPNKMIHYLGYISSASYSEPTLTLGASGKFFAADDIKVFTIDGTTVEEYNSASAVKKAVEDGFCYATAIEVSSTDSDIGTVYLSKKASTGDSAPVTVDKDATASQINSLLSSGADVTIPTGATVEDPVNVGSGTLTVEGNSTVKNVTLTEDSELVVKGTSNVTVASIPAGADVTVKVGATITVSGTQSEAITVESANGSSSMTKTEARSTIKNGVWTTDETITDADASTFDPSWDMYTINWTVTDATKDQTVRLAFFQGNSSTPVYWEQKTPSVTGTWMYHMPLKYIGNGYPGTGSENCGAGSWTGTYNASGSALFTTGTTYVCKIVEWDTESSTAGNTLFSCSFTYNG